MLTGKLYNIMDVVRIAEGDYNILFNCNSEHEIFKGHFPGEPILPGVCMIQFVRESLEIISNKKLQLKTSKTVKFINIIDPNKENKLYLDIKFNVIENGMIEAKAVIKNGIKVFFQIRGNWEVVL